MKKFLESLNIDETHTKFTQNAKFDSVKDNVLKLEDYNFQCDLLTLPLTKKKNKYIFAIIDLWSGDFDIEALQNKEPVSVLAAYKKMVKRNYINIAKASIQTDGGTEFKGVFHQYLYDNSILHRVVIPDRHKQQGNIENLNRQLGRLFNGYMNSMEIKSGLPYFEWDDIIHTVRDGYNKIKIKKKDEDPYEFKQAFTINNVFKFDKGDIVFRKYETPHDALGKKQNSQNFRTGDYKWDLTPRKIKKVVSYPTQNRYILEGFNNVSYTDTEIKKADNEKEEKYIVKEIIDKKVEKKIIYYKVWWKTYLKKNSTWEKEQSLLEDGLENHIKAFKKKKK